VCGPGTNSGQKPKGNGGTGNGGKGKGKGDDGKTKTIEQLLLEEAEAARLREEERQGRIKAGMADIDATFAGFGDDFYKNRKTAFLDFYQPQLNDQFKDARDQVTFALARNGTLNSTIAADEAAKLGKKYSLETGSLVSRAEGDASALRSNIENQKSAIKSQLNATGDVASATNDALARTKMIYEDRPDYSPLGDIFGGVGDAIGNYSAATRNRQLYDAYFGNSGGAARTVV